MKMKAILLFVLYYGLTCFRGVIAEQEPEIKRDYPYMAFIYFSDQSVVDAAGERFIRSAIIIRGNWLVTAAMGESFINAINGFPRKTLLARAGAISIDSHFSLNEDEDEQELEIVKIVRPLNNSATQWWTTDISLMKTLLPFKTTSAVGVKNLNFKQDKTLDLGKTCSILVYTKRPGNKTTDEKMMTLLYVDILKPSIENCGSHFSANTMICASDSDKNKEPVHEQFCRGNSGGPLICDKNVVGLQTYIDNDCTQPHLYQLLSVWDNFITCAVEDKCHEEPCGNLCDITNKDPVTPSTEYAEELITPSINITTLNSTAVQNVTETADSTQPNNFLIEDLQEETTLITSPTMTTTTGTVPITTPSRTTEYDSRPSLINRRLDDYEESTILTKYVPLRNGIRTPETLRQLTADLDHPRVVARSTPQKAKGKKRSSSWSIKNMYIITLFFGFLVLVCL